MLLGQHKKLLKILVLWFVLLQAISPFLHAHVGSSSAHGSQAIHMHDPGFGHPDIFPTFQDAASHGYVIDLGQAITQDSSFKLFAVLLLVVLWMPLIVKQGHPLRAYVLSKLPPRFERTRLNPRAPPHY